MFFQTARAACCCLLWEGVLFCLCRLPLPSACLPACCPCPPAVVCVGGGYYSAVCMSVCALRVPVRACLPACCPCPPAVSVCVGGGCYSAGCLSACLLSACLLPLPACVRACARVSAGVLLGEGSFLLSALLLRAVPCRARACLQVCCWGRGLFCCLPVAVCCTGLRWPAGRGARGSFLQHHFSK